MTQQRVTVVGKIVNVTTVCSLSRFYRVMLHQ